LMKLMVVVEVEQEPIFKPVGFDIGFCR
jgi:hypothetical protein